MAEFEDKLNSILSNPDAMSQLMTLAQSLGGNTDGTGEAASGSSEEAGGDAMSQEEERNPTVSESSDEVDFSSLLGGINPQMLGMLSGMMQGGASAEGNPNAALLSALRPFLRKSRQKKLDRAMEIASFSQIAKAALTLLKGGEDAV